MIVNLTNNWERKVLVSWGQLNHLSIPSNLDGVKDYCIPNDMYLGTVDGDIIDLHQILDGYQIEVLEVPDHCVAHVKAVADRLKLSSYQQGNTLTLNACSEKVWRLDVNTFLDLFDMNLLFKSTTFTLKTMTQVHLLESIGEKISELANDHYCFDEEKWSWVRTKAEPAELQTELLNVRNLALDLTGVTSFIRLRNESQADADALNIPTTGDGLVVSIDQIEPKLTLLGGAKTYNLVGYENSNLKFLSSFYFEHEGVVYKYSDEGEGDTITGTSSLGSVELPRDQVKQVTNNIFEGKHTYYLHAGKVMTHHDLTVDDGMFRLRGEDNWRYPGKNILVGIHNQDCLATLDNKTYLSTTNGLYCYEDKSFTQEDLELTSVRDYEGMLIDPCTDRKYMKLRHGHEAYPLNLNQSEVGLKMLVPLFEPIEKDPIYDMTEVEYDMYRFNNPVEKLQTTRIVIQTFDWMMNSGIVITRDNWVKGNFFESDETILKFKRMGVNIEVTPTNVIMTTELFKEAQTINYLITPHYERESGIRLIRC